MAVPKRRTSKSKKGMRRSHDGIKLQRTLIQCMNCDSMIPRHTVCPDCGYYRGVEVMQMKEN